MWFDLKKFWEISNFTVEIKSDFGEDLFKQDKLLENLVILSCISIEATTISRTQARWKNPLTPSFKLSPDILESFPKQNKHDQDEKKHFITIRMKRNTIWPDGVTSDDDHDDVDADSGKHHLSFPQSPLQQTERKEITQ